MTYIFRVFENGILHVGDSSLEKNGKQSSFNEHHFNALVKYNEKYNGKFFTVGYKKIIFSQYVGLIQTGDISIEVLPKIGNTPTALEESEKLYGALIDILRFCKRINLNTSTPANIRIHQTTLLDIFLEMFLDGFLDILHRGLHKKYLVNQDNLKTVKGKILFGIHLRKNAIAKQNIYCDYTEYDYNHKLNQILFKALRISKIIDTNQRFSDKIQQIEIQLPKISEKEFSKKDFEGIHLSRAEDKYSEMLKLAELIILNFSQGLFSGEENVFSLLFDMSMLYEQFVLKLLQKDSETVSYRIRGQMPKYFWENKRIKPDIVVSDKLTEQNFFIIDTKWKMPLDDKPSDNDLKQMYVYNKYFKVKHSILLYPTIQNELEYKGVYRDEENHQQHSDSFCSIRKLKFEFKGNRLDFEKVSLQLKKIVNESLPILKTG